METEFKEKLQVWLEDVATTCDKYAREIDIDFYPFQSPLPKDKSINLLIIAINPGGDKKYTTMLEEKSKDFGKQINKRSADMLAYGENTYAVKPQWEIENKLKGNDVMRGKLNRVFTSQMLKNSLLESTVMNLYYFNTQNTEKLGELNNDIKKYCIYKTNEFIDIVNPKCVLIFTTDEKELSNCGVRGIKPIRNFVKEGILNGRKIIAIPNPGFYRAYSTINGEIMGKIIESYLTE